MQVKGSRYKVRHQSLGAASLQDLVTNKYQLLNGRSYSWGREQQVQVLL